MKTLHILVAQLERLKNFEYKIQLIELYDSQTADINTITGDTATAPYVLENKEEINKKKNKILLKVLMDMNVSYIILQEHLLGQNKIQHHLIIYFLQPQMV